MCNFPTIFSKIFLQTVIPHSTAFFAKGESVCHRKTAPLPKGSWICQRQRLRDNLRLLLQKYPVKDIKKDSNYFLITILDSTLHTET